MDSKTTKSFLILFIVATIFTIAAAIAEEKKMGRYPMFWMNGLRISHYFIFFISFSYAFMFQDDVLDLIYLSFMMWLFGHWTYLKNECILGYVENRHYIPGYEMGQYASHNLYVRVLFGDLTRTIMLTFGFLSIVSVFIVLERVELAMMIKILIAMVMITFTIFGFTTKY
jgi:hypothetical protein